MKLGMGVVVGAGVAVVRGTSVAVGTGVAVPATVGAAVVAAVLATVAAVVPGRAGTATGPTGADDRCSMIDTYVSTPLEAPVPVLAVVVPDGVGVPVDAVDVVLGAEPAVPTVGVPLTVPLAEVERDEDGSVNISMNTTVSPVDVTFRKLPARERGVVPLPL